MARERKNFIISCLLTQLRGLFLIELISKVIIIWISCCWWADDPPEGVAWRNANWMGEKETFSTAENSIRNYHISSNSSRHHSFIIPKGLRRCRCLDACQKGRKGRAIAFGVCTERWIIISFSVTLFRPYIKKGRTRKPNSHRYVTVKFIIEWIMKSYLRNDEEFSNFPLTFFFHFAYSRSRKLSTCVWKMGN